MSDSNQSSGQSLNLRHIIGALLLALTALCMGACSATRLGYQNAPELGYWWLDSYFDFNNAQSLKLREDLASLQAWHRETELPIYVNMLSGLQKAALLDTTPEQLCRLYGEVRPRLQAILDRMEPTVSTLAPTLTSVQLDHLAQQFEKRNRKWREEWLDVTADQRENRRIRQMTERVENFYGRLGEPQIAVLRAGLAASPMDASLGHRESRRRQQDILQTLRPLPTASQGAASIASTLRGLLERSLDSPDPLYRNYLEKLTQAHCRTFAALHNSSTPAQRLRLLETLKDYQDDARALLPVKR